jgi:outer membrane protein TolC
MALMITFDSADERFVLLRNGATRAERLRSQPVRSRLRDGVLTRIVDSLVARDPPAPLGLAELTRRPGRKRSLAEWLASNVHLAHAIHRRLMGRKRCSVRRRLTFLAIACLCTPSTLCAQIISLAEAVRAVEANNRAIHVAELEHEKALGEVKAASTNRFPIFSVTALGSQPLSQLGITLERGSLGVYPFDGPIPGKTTTLEDPLRFGFIGYASVAQPLTQQHKIGLGIDLTRVGAEAASEQLRAKRQAVVNEVRRLYYGIAQAESGRKTLHATVDFLQQLDRETNQQVVQRVALQADLLAVKAQLAQAEYALLKMDDPIQTQKEQLNRLMGRPIDTPFEIDQASIVDTEGVSLQDAYAEALASRPEIRLARIQQRKAELERRLKSAERIPDVSLSLIALRTVNFSSTLPNNLSSVGIQAAWDVFDWGKKREQLEIKREAEAQAALELREAEALVMVDVGHQYRRIIEARKELDLARALQSSSIEAFRVARNRYLQRETMLSDVVKVQSSLAEADHHYTQALMNLATAQADFEKALGRDR